MQRHLKTLLAVSTLFAGLTAAPTLYAHDSGGAGGSMMGRGMMGEGGMMGMTAMMKECSRMMQAMMGDEHRGERPNEQWREQSPQPEQPHSEEDAG